MTRGPISQPLSRRAEALGNSERALPRPLFGALAEPGRPLDAPTRAFMEGRFGHDFSHVRVHAEEAGAGSARELGARAWAVGSHIGFAAHAYEPSTPRGARLLAHELSHTVQQRSARASLPGSLALERRGSRAEVEATHAADAVVSGAPLPALTPSAPRVALQEDDSAPQPAPPPPQTGTPQRGTSSQNACGRRGTTTVAGFNNSTSGPHISSIAVAINPNADSAVTLTWANLPAGVSPTPPTSLRASPGAGRCSKDCSDPTQSNEDNSLCTPIGNFTILGYACRLPEDATAQFVSWIVFPQRGIAFHNYPTVPSYPASHGCVRMDAAERGGEWIYDNSLAGVTTVAISRPAGNPGPKCYNGRVLRDRPGYVAPTPTPPAPEPPAPE